MGRDKKNRNEALNGLHEFITQTVKIHCGLCPRGEFKTDTDKVNFSTYLHQKGWRIKDDEALCPTCYQEKVKK